MSTSVADPAPSALSNPPSTTENEIPPAPTTSAIMDRRATTLTQAFSGALDATLKKISYENFAACFPTAATYKPEVLKRFWRDFVEKLGEKSRKEFDGILKERDVIPSLNALDSLIRDALERKTIAEQDARSKGQPIEYPTPPHTLSPESLMVAHLGPFLTAQQTTLKATLDILEKQNIALGETIQQQRGEMERLVGSLEDLVGDLKRAAEIVQSDELVGLTSEMREIHEELRDAP